MPPTASAALNMTRRDRELDELAGGRVVDVLVVGGGVTGAGIALDAATRGLSVALLERRDLAYGTSRFSSKLVHGGLRYLANGEVAIAWESAQERACILEHIAPHLTHPLPMLVPWLPDLGWTARRFTSAGMRAGDLLRRFARTSKTLLPKPRLVSASKARQLAPGLRADVQGGIVAYDGQLEDDARLVIAIARTAASYGAIVITGTQVTHLDGDGAEFVDEQTGASGRINARHVINATGVWAATLDPNIRLRPSRGAHVVFDATSIGSPTVSIHVPVPGAYGRWVFGMPQADGLTYLGLTDDEVDGTVEYEAQVTPAEQEFLLSTFNTALQTPLTGEDVIGGYAGYRPLLSGAAGRTADLSRKHAIVESSTGVLTVVGGKLTTYRRMAQDAIDAVVRRRGLRAGPCRTRRLGLVGAAPRTQLQNIDAPPRLVRRYGIEAPNVASLAIDDPTLLQPIAPDIPVLGVELRFGIEAEGARNVDDLLDRRVRLGLVPERRERAYDAATRIFERYAAAFS